MKLPFRILKVCSAFRASNSIGGFWRSIHQSAVRMDCTGSPSLVAVCQMTSRADKEQNFQTCNQQIQEAKARGAQMVFLPEAFDFIGESRKQTLSLVEPLNGPLIQKYKTLALEHQIWLSLGGFHEQGSDDNQKLRNSHVCINRDGEIAAVYRKTHLFDVEIPEKGVRLRESEYVMKGEEIVPPVATPIGKVGLGICYDMRFPEMSLALCRMGADILTFPSAFTVSTGLAHWETLLRTRAVETQCYVIAAAQTGVHNTKRSSYGHAMVIDPWGTVIAQCMEGIGIAVAKIDLPYLRRVRKEMPVWDHRRYDLYGHVQVKGTAHMKDGEENCPTAMQEELPGGKESLQFGHVNVKGSLVFYKTRHTFAFVNKKCVVPGHVLVAPVRVAERLSNLTHYEVSDLFQVVQKVQGVMEHVHHCSSSTVSVQDGPDAGQTVQHVHVHVLPRKPGDFKRNDDIYVELESHDKEEIPRWRDEEEMIRESKMLRKYF